MKIAVIIPVFNHGGTLSEVIDGVHAVTKGLEEVGEIVVVDDGSTDGASQVLPGIRELTVLKHERNRGKGCALLTGFRYSFEKGYTHAVTVDADGQHCPEDIEKLVRTARTYPDDLIIGQRDMDAAGKLVPVWSKRGRNASRFWLRVETGQDIPDSQCGLRVYPLAHVLASRYRFSRFDFETEVLARMAWGGLRIRSVPITCIYFPGALHISHFRPVMDTLRGIRANAYLVMRRLAPIPTRRLIGDGELRPEFGKWWKRATWRDAIQNAVNSGSSNSELATAFAMGIFVGLTPFYLLQTLLVIYLARRLHLNVLAAVIGSQISIPPLAPIWFVLSYGVGNMLLHGRWVATDAATFSPQMLPAFLVGSLSVAIVLTLAGLVTARCVLFSVRPERMGTSAGERGGG